MHCSSSVCSALSALQWFHPSASLRAGRGSTSLLTNASGQKVPDSALHYFPYGATQAGDPAALPTEYNFTGQRLDTSTGLLYYGARYYDPALGRFISADSIVPVPGNPQALNRFSYCVNNPLKYTDPTGHVYDPGGLSGKPENKCPPVPPVPVPPLPGSGSDGNGSTSNTPSNTAGNQSVPDDEIIPPWQFWRFDAFGVRVNFSGAFVLGGSINFDAFWNKNTNEVSIYATPAGQAGALFGGDITLGFIEIANLPSNEDYRE